MIEVIGSNPFSFFQFDLIFFSLTVHLSICHRGSLFYSPDLKPRVPEGKGGGCVIVRDVKEFGLEWRWQCDKLSDEIGPSS